MNPRSGLHRMMAALSFAAVAGSACVTWAPATEPVPEVIARLAAARGVPASEIDARCRQALLTMFARGLVTFDMADMPPGPSEDALEGSVEADDEPLELIAR